MLIYLNTDKSITEFKVNKEDLSFKAVVAMAQNRAIGCSNKIPWHIPEDFKWFKQLTMGNILVMGRKTFESIGKPLPGRTTFILSHQKTLFPGVQTISGLNEIKKYLGVDDKRSIFICGGANVYSQTIHLCTDVYLTLVKRTVLEADAFMPPFEHLFSKGTTLQDHPEFSIIHYSK